MFKYLSASNWTYRKPSKLSPESPTLRWSTHTPAISGQDRDKFGIVFNVLVRHKLIRLSMENVYPTEKFRKVYAIMNKSVGEMVNKHTPQIDHDL